LSKNNEFTGSAHKDKKIRIYNEKSMMVETVIPIIGDKITSFIISPHFKYVGFVSSSDCIYITKLSVIRDKVLVTKSKKIHIVKITKDLHKVIYVNENQEIIISSMHHDHHQ
jgi:hypothetical protein